MIDFGIAHFKEATTRATGRMYLGTPRYSAPEQIQGLAPSARTDLYAVGLVLYDCLCGRGPFDPTGENLESHEMMRAHLERAPAPLSTYWTDVPDELEDLVAALVAKTPNNRPPNASLVALRLREIKARVLAEQAPALMPFDPNRTEPTPFDNRQIRYSADTQRDAAPPDGAAQPMRTTQRMEPMAPLGPAGTIRLPVLSAEGPTFGQPWTADGGAGAPTATSEPVDRNAPTPSMAPELPRLPTHGTEEGCVPDGDDDLGSSPLGAAGGRVTPTPAPAAGVQTSGGPGTLSNAPAIVSVLPSVPIRRDGAFARVAAATAGLVAAVALSVAIWALRHTPGSGPGSPAAAIPIGATTAAATRAGAPRKTPAPTTPTTPAASLASPSASAAPAASEPSVSPPVSAASAATAPSAAPPRLATTQGSPPAAARAREKPKTDPLLELKRTFSSSPAPPERHAPAF